MFLDGAISPRSFASHTAPEIRELAAKPGSILLVPVGSIEQHGRHLPVATDSILAEAAATAGVERLDDDVPILVTPPLWSGHSPHHLSLGGTLSLDADQLLDVLESVADSGLKNGFDAVVLCNGHGGNGSIISTAVSAIGSTHPDAEVVGVTYFRLAGEFIDDIRESDIGGMAHGGEFETSLMLHLHPELVREDRMDAEFLEQPHPHSLQDMFAGGPVSVYREFEEYSATGAIGAPEDATAEKGEAILDGIGEAIAEVLESTHASAAED